MKYLFELKYCDTTIEDMEIIAKALNFEFNIQYDIDKIRIYV